MINELREICGMLPMSRKVHLFILTFWIIGFGLGGWLYTFGLKKNIKWIKICSVTYFGFGVLGMALLFVWGTSLLGIVSAQQKIICDEIIPLNKKIEEENKLKEKLEIIENSQKIEHENRKVIDETPEGYYTDSANKENENIRNEKYDKTENNKNFKMFPNTLRDGDFEYLVTNNQVVIVKFHGLRTETHAIIPEKIQDMPVVKLGKFSFTHIFKKIDGKYTDNLIKVTLPQTLEEIEGGSFRDHHNLSEVDLPPKIAVITEFTFQNCGFTNLVLPNTVQKIEKNAFWINLKLKSVIIPSSVKFIGKGAFSGCRNLTNIEILGTNTVIDAEAFQYCPRQPANPQSPTSPQQNP